MCGIAAIIGNIQCYEYIMFALKMLQNRGYDSAGICGLYNNNFILHKYATRQTLSAINILETVGDLYKNCSVCIGHSRWATTGIISDENAHPHIDFKNRFSLVHNGIIENYEILKKELINTYSVTFKSETDTEVIVNLISVYYDKLGDIKQAIEHAINRLEGTWGLVILCRDDPEKIYCARHGSPLLIGFGDNYTMISSEQSGFYKTVKNYICLNNHDLIIIEKNNVGFKNMHEYEIRKINNLQYDLTPEPYAHWTLKEIYEQYESSFRALGHNGRIINNKFVKLGGLQDHEHYLKDVDNLILLGCGTSYNAGLYVTHKFKEISGFNTVQIFDAADFTSYDIPKNGKTILLLISQSGETKDVHRCVDIAKELGIFTIGVVNVVDSLIAREVNAGVYLNCGREVAVASTKAFSSQVIVLHLIAVWFAQIKNINEMARHNIINNLVKLPLDIKNTILHSHDKCKYIAKYLEKYNNLFILGKANLEAVAKEGALKIKEISYIHAEGYSSSGLKHGSYAMIDNNFPIIMNIPNDKHYVRNVCTIDELLSKGAFVICISDADIEKTNYLIKIPNNTIFVGLLSVIVCQLIAYELALLKNNNPDYPRNLAKCITVD